MPANTDKDVKVAAVTPPDKAANTDKDVKGDTGLILFPVKLKSLNPRENSGLHLVYLPHKQVVEFNNGRAEVNSGIKKELEIMGVI